MNILMVGDYTNDPKLGSTKVYYKLQEEFATLGHRCDLRFAEDLGYLSCPSHLRQALAPCFASQVVSKTFRDGILYDVIDVAGAEGFILGMQKRFGAYSQTALVSRSHGLEHLNYRRMLDDHQAGLLHKPWSRRLWFPAVRLSQVAGAARLADRLIVLNSGDEKFALDHRWKSSNKIDCIPHGISDRLLSEETENPNTMRGAGLLFCGSWTGMKGVHYLVTAISQLVTENAGVPLTILGGGLPEAVIRSSFPGTVQPLLTVLERADESEVIRQYRRHDALVFPSTYEGFGMVLLEAMSQGLPAVSTPVGCAPLLIRDEENGLLVRPRDSEALASAIKRIMTDPETRHRLGKNAKREAQAFTWRRTAMLTLDSYEKARNQRSTATHSGSAKITKNSTLEVLE